MTAQTLADNPNFCFCPAYDVETRSSRSTLSSKAWPAMSPRPSLR